MMLTEWPFLGFLLPPMLVPVLLTLVGQWLSRRVLLRLGVYRWFWNPLLVDLALFFVLLWGVLTLAGTFPSAV